MVSVLVLIYFGRSQVGHITKTNCLTFQIVWLSLLLEILSNIFVASACYPVRNVINFENNIKLSCRAIFLHYHKRQNKNLNISRNKELLR